MQYIILTGDENLTLDAVRKIEHYDSISHHDVHKDRFCVDYGKDHIFYHYSEDTNDYEEEDIEKIPYENPHFITMIYTDVERMKKVIQQDNFLRGIYVDNDAGLIMPIEEFIYMGMPMGT